MLNVITRYRIVEKVYLGKDPQITVQLKDFLVDLYGHVLVFLAKAKRFSSKSGKSESKPPVVCLNLSNQSQSTIATSSHLR